MAKQDTSNSYLMIELTSEQVDEIIHQEMLWIINNESGSKHKVDIENWKKLQKAARVIMGNVAHSK